MWVHGCNLQGNFLKGSQDGLGSSNVLHHECRYMAAQLEATFKESMQVRVRMDKEDEDTFELGQNPIEDPAGQPQMTTWSLTPSPLTMATSWPTCAACRSPSSMTS